MEEMNPISRDFKGVWIPKKVWLDTDLNALDKIILVEIDSLDNGEKGCYASNKYLAEFCQCSESKVSRSISKLVKLGYISFESFNGRHREIKSLLEKKQGRLGKKARQTRQKSKADSAKKQAINIDNNIDNNIEIKKEIYKEKKKESNDHFSKISKNDRVSVDEINGKNLEIEKNQVCDDTYAINEKNSVLSEKKSNSDNKKTPRVNEKLEFDKLWDLYPRKQGKKAAFAAFTRARKQGVALDTIASGIKSYVHYIDSKKISQEYIKQGSTFFTQHSWDDDWSLPKGYSFYNSKPNYDIEAYERANKNIFDSLMDEEEANKKEFVEVEVDDYDQE